MAEEDKEEEAKEEERGRGGKEKEYERRKQAEREAKPESEKRKRREPGDKAETTETTAEGATLITRRLVRTEQNTKSNRPTPELTEPPTVETPDLATYDIHTETVWGGGGGEILLSSSAAPHQVIQILDASTGVTDL